jgi:hypothetical protein
MSDANMKYFIWVCVTKKLIKKKYIFKKCCLAKRGVIWDRHAKEICGRAEKLLKAM